ncbi:MAG TPA: hypothetical protein PKA63_14220 [Oligoflexia bacterium]|nr:hypothetical protein [Oligoflexia bacterium]HMP49820.1 hypothetical protein [Oligoflexia bacterium]
MSISDHDTNPSDPEARVRLLLGEIENVLNVAYVAKNLHSGNFNTGSNLESKLEVLSVKEGEVSSLETKGAVVTNLLDALDAYLSSLELWQERHREFILGISSGEISISDASRDKMRTNLDKLKEVHEALMGFASNLQDNVGEELADVNKKALAIKRYVDILPSRVSVTRKKEG